MNEVELLSGDCLFNSRGKVQGDRDTDYRLTARDRKGSAYGDKPVTEIRNGAGCGSNDSDIVAYLGILAVKSGDVIGYPARMSEIIGSNQCYLHQ